MANDTHRIWIIILREQKCMFKGYVSFHAIANPFYSEYIFMPQPAEIIIKLETGKVKLDKWNWTSTIVSTQDPVNLINNT